MRTSNKLEYISSALKEYKNLRAEVLAIHEKIKENKNAIDSIDNIDINVEEVEALVKEIKESISQNSDDIIDIIKRIENISDNAIRTGFENLSINRKYTYDSKGRIVKETLTGDSNKIIKYEYDNLGNVIEENIFEGEERVGGKKYIYDDDYNIVDVISDNADVVNIAVMDYALKDLDQRLKRIENNDIISLNSVLNAESATRLINKVNEMSILVDSLVGILPDDLTNMGIIPDILERLNYLESVVSGEYNMYSFVVKSNISKYALPDYITNRATVYMEGLLLERGDDYDIEKGHIIFYIPLIDEFEVLIKH